MPNKTFDFPEEAYIALTDLAHIRIVVSIATAIHHPVGKEILALLYPIQEQIYGAINVKTI